MKQETRNLNQKHKKEQAISYANILRHTDLSNRINDMQYEFLQKLHNNPLPKINIDTESNLLLKQGIEVKKITLEGRSLSLTTEKIYNAKQLRVIYKNDRYQIPTEKFDEKFLSDISSFNDKLIRFVTIWKFSKEKRMFYLNIYESHSSIPTPHASSSSICTGSHTDYVNAIPELNSYHIYMIWSGMEKINANSLLVKYFHNAENERINLNLESKEFIKRHEKEFNDYIVTPHDQESE